MNKPHLPAAGRENVHPDDTSGQGGHRDKSKIKM